MTTQNHSVSLTSRKLGKTDLHTPPLVFGANVFGWTADKDTSFSLLDRFIDAGLSGLSAKRIMIAVDDASAFIRH